MYRTHTTPTRNKAKRIPRGALLLAVAAALAAGAGAISTFTSSPASAEAILGGIRPAPVAPQLLELNLGGKLLTVRGDSHEPGAIVDFYGRRERSGQTQGNQLWQFVPNTNDVSANSFTSGGAGLLKNVESGLCLDVPNSTLELDVAIKQQPCVGGLNQQWQTIRLPGGGYGIAAGHGDIYLGNNGPLCANGPADSDLVVTKNSGSLVCGTWQAKSVLARVGTTWAISEGANRELDGRNATGASGVLAYTAPATPGVPTAPTATWVVQVVGTIRAQPSGSVLPVHRILSVPNGDWSKATCLTARGANPTIGTLIDTYACDPNSVLQKNQMWVYLNHSSLLDPARRVWVGAPLANVAAIDLNVDSFKWPVVQVQDTYNPAKNISLQDQTSWRNYPLSNDPQMWNFQGPRLPPAPVAAPSTTQPPTSGGGGLCYACLLEG